MLILAVDTTSEVGGVGIFRDDECLARVASDGPANGYAVSLFHMVHHVTEEAKLRHGVPVRGLGEMDLIAVATGPGSFTGIRVGLAAAQGWAKAFALPIRGVPVLKALVEAAQVRTDWAVPIMDGRREEFYVGLFRCEPEGDASYAEFQQVAGEGWLLKPAELGSFLSTHIPKESAATCVVRGHDEAALALRDSLPSPFQWQAVSGTLVESIARLGFRDYRVGKQQAEGDLDALYIRRTDAELNLKG